MRFLKLFAVFLLCVSLCSCWDSIPIEDCAHPVIGAYDVPEDGKQGVTVTGIYYQSLSGEPVSAEIISLTESSVGETRQKRAGYNFESWSTSMLNVLMYGKELSQKGLWPYIDIMYRSPGTSATIKLAVASERADKILKEASPEEEVRAAYITNVVLTANENSLLPSLDIVGFMKDYYTPGCNSVLPIVGLDPEGKPVLSGGAVMKKDVMVGELDYEQTNMYVMLRENHSTGIMVYECELRWEKCEVTALCNISRRIKTKKQGDSFNFEITLDINADVMEISSQNSITPSVQEVEILAEELNKNVEDRAYEYLNYIHNELGLDNLGLAREALALAREGQERYDTAEFWKSVTVAVDAQSVLEAVTP